MPDWISAIILGVVEGLTEFIPVSSTGHLLLAKTVLGLPPGFWDPFIVLIQLGAILGVVALYFRRLWAVLTTLPTSQRSRHFVLSVLVAFLPGALVGALLHDVIKDVLFLSPRLICVSLILGGLVLLVIDRRGAELLPLDTVRGTDSPEPRQGCRSVGHADGAAEESWRPGRPELARRQDGGRLPDRGHVRHQLLEDLYVGSAPARPGRSRGDYVPRRQSRDAD